MKTRLFAAAAPAALLAADLAAQNLVANGRFDRDVAGWQADAFATIAFVAEDAGGSPASGSALVRNVSPGPSNGAGVQQCIAGPAIREGTTYSWGGAVRNPAGQGRTGRAFVGLRWYASADCTGTPGSQPRNSTTTVGTWVRLAATSTAPAGTRSVEFVAFPSKVEAGGQLDVLFDDLFFFVPQQTVLTVPSSASAHGAAGTFFHTDLWVTNLSRSNAQTVTARFRCFVSLPCNGAPRTIILAPRETLLVADVVGTLLASPESAGAIELEYDAAAGEIAATSRTYTPSLPSPTTGTAIPAVPASAARTRVLFLGLGSNGGSLASGFRTNAGAYNPNDVPVDVTFTLSDRLGILLGQTTRTFAPREAFQINDVFAVAGAGGTVTTNATLAVTSALPVHAFATVIDNRSGDSVWAAPVEDP